MVEDIFYERMMRRSDPKPTYSMTTHIDNLSPHYTNERFKKPQTVWGAEEKGINYDYSDRLWQWNYDNAKAAAELANQNATRNTAKWCTIFLEHYFGKPVQLRHIMAGFNISNGYPYQIFGYRFVEA
jgi:hypothetical protein